MPESQLPFYLCTGFHRSGTSLLAQSLAKGGMHMGGELMGASFSNPLGHVEDMPIVRTHDKLFKINGTDWRYRDHGPLIKPNWLPNYLQRYITDSVKKHKFCGVKDPRATFFLRDWQAAGKGRIRYVFVYRHWSTAVNSIFNRAARHITNGTAAVASNKLNYSFWQSPDTAVNMWLATNKRILEFYLHHKASCLLISQEAFVDTNAKVQQVAGKIGLPAKCLAGDSFKRNLMSNHAPNLMRDLYSSEKRIEVESLWAELQEVADVATTLKPKFVKVEGFPTIEQLNINCAAEQPVNSRENRIDISDLSWEEALGFIVRIPQHLFNESTVEQLLGRPFGLSDHFDRLAKICHKNNLYLHTKLAKMRAMHTFSGSWDISKWKLYTDSDHAWWKTTEDAMPQVIPFSLRPLSDLEKLKEVSDIGAISADWLKVKALLNNCQKYRFNNLVVLILLYRRNLSAEDYRFLASCCLENRLFFCAEYAFIKVLRFSYRAEDLVPLGDLYLKLKLYVKALQCYEEANNLSVNTGAVLARIANAHLLLGDGRLARQYLSKAVLLSPNNRVVALCQNQLSESAQELQKGDLALSSQLAELFQMPTLESYEQRISLTKQELDIDKLVDNYRQLRAFLLRDNYSWLRNGVRPLSPEAANYLSYLTYHHWKKLWGPAVIDSVLGVTVTVADDYQFVETSACNPSKIAIYLELDLNSSLGLLELITRAIKYPISWVIVAPKSLKDKVLNYVSKYSANTTFYSDCETWLAIQEKELNKYDVVCKLHLKRDSSNVELPNYHLQQIFCLLGDSEQVNDILKSFSDQKSVGMIIPSYHPHLACKLASEPQHEELCRVASSLGLVVDTPFYAYPEGQMFWYRSEILSESLIAYLTEIPTETLYKVLPAILSARKISTKLSHTL
jgi:hypothetical protein